MWWPFFLRGWGFTALQQFQLLAGWLAAGDSRKEQAKTTRCDFIEKVNDPHISRSCIANSWQSQNRFFLPKANLGKSDWLKMNWMGCFQDETERSQIWNPSHLAALQDYEIKIMEVSFVSEHQMWWKLLIIPITQFYRCQCFSSLYIAHSWCGSVRAHLVSLVAVCCRDSRRSWSDCSGRMFFSSSSLLDGRLLSFMARESFRKTFIARVPSETTAEAK